MERLFDQQQRNRITLTLERKPEDDHKEDVICLDDMINIIITEVRNNTQNIDALKKQIEHLQNKLFTLSSLPS